MIEGKYRLLNIVKIFSFVDLKNPLDLVRH